MQWTKVDSVWVGIPDDLGIIQYSLRCYVIGVDWRVDQHGHWMLRAVRDSGVAEEVQLDRGRPPEAIERLQQHAEAHYRRLAEQY